MCWYKIASPFLTFISLLVFFLSMTILNLHKHTRFNQIEIRLISWWWGKTILKISRYNWSFSVLVCICSLHMAVHQYELVNIWFFMNFFSIQLYIAVNFSAPLGYLKSRHSNSTWIKKMRSIQYQYSGSGYSQKFQLILRKLLYLLLNSDHTHFSANSYKYSYNRQSAR